MQIEPSRIQDKPTAVSSNVTSVARNRSHLHEKSLPPFLSFSLPFLSVMHTPTLLLPAVEAPVVVTSRQQRYVDVMNKKIG